MHLPRVLGVAIKWRDMCVLVREKLVREIQSDTWVDTDSFSLVRRAPA